MTEIMEFNPKKYKNSIAACKQAIKTYNQRSKQAKQARMKVAKICISLKRMCRITVIAKDIDLGYTTLQSWITEYERANNDAIVAIVSKEGDKINRAALNRTLIGVGKDSTPKEIKDTYRKEKNKAEDDIRLDYLVKQMHKVNFSICSELVLAKVDQEHLSTLKILCSEVVEKINKHMGASRGKSNTRPVVQ